MYQLKNPKVICCPLEYAMDMFGCKWKSRIICILDTYSVLRFSAIKRQLTDISEQVLTSTLKELVSDGLAIRKSYDEIPPKVEYSLTEKGLTILPIFRSLCRWSKTYYSSEGQGELSGQCLTCVHNQSSAKKPD